MQAHRYADTRLVLVGDAAHGIHPIAGQGLNLGFRDVIALSELLIEAHASGGDVGSPALLRSYQRARRPDNLLMLAATDGLDRLFSNDSRLLRLVARHRHRRGASRAEAEAGVHASGDGAGRCAARRLMIALRPGRGGERHRMDRLTRRHSLQLGAGLFAASALAPAAARAEIKVADVKPPSFPLEKGAQLHVLRPTKYIDADETIFLANSKRFTEQSGVAVKVDFVNWPDMPTQTAVAANTGAGPDIIVAFGPIRICSSARSSI